MREPLGVNYGARFVTDAGTGSPVSSYMRVWRASADALTDLTGDSCTDVEAPLASVIYDEDEGTTTTGGCISPCTQPSFNYLYETQRANVATGDALDSTDGAFLSVATGFVNGWIAMDFFNAVPGVTDLDQAWVGYDFEASGLANVNTGIEGVSFDRSNCQPVGFENFGGFVVPVDPALPSSVGDGPLVYP